jgi:hypothetical protein
MPSEPPSQLPEKVSPPAGAGSLSLPSGRTVCVRTGAGREEIEIRSPAGQMELRIALTPQGPVLQLRGARLEIDSTDAVAVNCRQFEINASEGVKINSAGDIDLHGQGEMRVRTAGSTSIDSDWVNLNCGDRTGYHDDPDHPDPPDPPDHPAKEPPALEESP